MPKIYWCLTLSVIMLVMSSFMCSKETEASRSQSEDENINITVDFTKFPSHTTFTITGESGQGVFKFDSDSSKTYHTSIPGGLYRISWKLLGLSADANYKAKWLNESQGTVVPWESGTYTYGKRNIYGAYTFSRERK